MTSQAIFWSSLTEPLNVSTTFLTQLEKDSFLIERVFFHSNAKVAWNGMGLRSFGGQFSFTNGTKIPSSDTSWNGVADLLHSFSANDCGQTV